MMAQGTWRFRPTLWPTVIVAITLPVLIGLGTWQLHRLEWKSDLLDHMAERMAMEAVPMPEQITDPEAWAFRRVWVEGRFLHERELYLTGRTLEGQAGIHVVTPLLRSDAPIPPAVLVDLGWAPVGWERRRIPADDLAADPVRVEGVLRGAGRQGWMQPDNQPEDNVWFWLDVPEMGRAAGLSDVAPLVLVAAPGEGAAGEDNGPPVATEVRVDIPNNHLSYTFTWYALAVVLIAIYGIYHWNRPEARS